MPGGSGGTILHFDDKVRQAAVGSARYVLCKSAALDMGMHALGQGLGWARQKMGLTGGQLDDAFQVPAHAYGRRTVHLRCTWFDGWDPMGWEWNGWVGWRGRDTYVHPFWPGGARYSRRGRDGPFRHRTARLERPGQSRLACYHGTSREYDVTRPRP